MLPVLRRTSLDFAYLTLSLLTSIVALAVWITALSVSLSLAIFVIGLPVVIGAAFVMRWTVELDRRNAALVFGRPVRGNYRDHRAQGIVARLKATVRDPQVWRDLSWLITHSVLGLAFGIIAISLVATRRRDRHAAGLVLDSAGRHRTRALAGQLAADRARDRAAGDPAGRRHALRPAGHGPLPCLAGRRAPRPSIAQTTWLDNFVPGGKGPHTADAVASAITNTPLAAGTGAFGGLVSMSWLAVVVSVFVSLGCGALLGALSVKLAGVFAKVGASRSSEPKLAAPA